MSAGQCARMNVLQAIDRSLCAFKQITGMPPHRWLLMQRVTRAKDLLRGTITPIAEIALTCGFSDQSHLTRVFSKTFGISPGAWRRQWRA